MLMKMKWMTEFWENLKSYTVSKAKYRSGKFIYEIIFIQKTR